MHLVRHAMRYPFDRPAGSYVYVNGETLPLAEFHREHAGESTVRVPGGIVSLSHHLRTAEIDPAGLREPRLPIIASGSNASPLRLAQKFPASPRDVVIPVVQAMLHDFAPVYSAHIASYGSVPATLQHVPGSTSTVFVTWLTADQLERMHESEALGRNYGFARMSGIRLVFPERQVEAAFAYIGLRGNLHIDGGHVALADDATPHPALQARTQRQVQSLVRDLLAPGMALEGFIAENVHDRVLRDRRTRLLRAFSHGFTHAGSRFAHGPVRRLFDRLPDIADHG